MARNISATVQIGATMASSVGSVFGRVGKQIDSLGGSLSKLKKQSSEVLKLQAAQGKLAEAKAKGNAAATARYTAQVEKLSASLTEAGVDTSQLTKEQERLAKSIGEVEKKLGQFKRIGDAFSKLKTDAKAVGDAFGGLKDKLGGAFTRLGVAGGVVGGAIAGVGYLTAEFVDQGDALADQAEGLNMSTKALQTWQFAAGTVGIESEKLGSILSKLQSKIADGSDGTKESFAALGLSYSKLKRMSPEQQLTHITEAFARLPEGVNKTALANDIFGKSGYKLLPVLKAGAAGLKDIYDQAKATGYILSDDTNDAVNKADAAFNQFKLQLTGFKNQALAPLLPVFTDMISQLGRIITDHGPKLTAWIQTAGKSFMENLAPAIGNFVTNDLPPLIANIGSVVTGLTNLATYLADVTGGWDNLAIGLVALNFAPALAGLASLGMSIGTLVVQMGAFAGPAAIARITMLGTTMKAMAVASWAAVGPWGLIAAGIIAIGAVIYTFKDQIMDLIDSAITPLLDSLREIGAWFANSAVGKVFGLDKYNIDGTAQKDKAPVDAMVPYQNNEAMKSDLMRQIMPAENMPASGATNNVKQDFQINVTAPSADPAAVGGAVKSALKSMKLYDTTGTLVPQ
jgi:hypothetical protein